jgi:hypothetical protein
MKWDHHFQAAGFYFQQIELFHSRADCTAADLFNNSNAMIGINDLVAYVEISVGNHKVVPTGQGQERNNTTLFYPKLRRKRNFGACLSAFRTRFTTSSDA